MKKLLWVALAALLAIMVIDDGPSPGRCMRAYFRYGLDLPRCPDGKLIQTARVQATGIRRGAKARIAIAAVAHYTVHDADGERTAELPDLHELAVTLVDAKHAARPIHVERWQARAGATTGTFTVPDVPDGDYRLHVTYKTSLGAGAIDAPVALYAPARIHVITDRPLYEPGNTVKFRAVVLRARDLAPLDGRPGRWLVKDPAGEVLLEEQAPAGPWGVVAGSFPLDKGAQTGRWTIAWSSGDATDEVPITVQPFRLPRFRVDASADRPFYRPGDKPAIHGAVIYSSGAPVAGAHLAIQWDVEGAWPPPRAWKQKLLPTQATTGANGRFALALPEVPTDLQGHVTLAAQIAATDPAGDRVEGAASVLLSQDGIDVSSVTELGDGLVQGFNNRLYLRVTTPDGRPLPGTAIHVRRAWQPNDNGIPAKLDEDGVASLQIDPGPPVNVVIPALPWRPAPRPPVVTRGEPQELITGQGASLVDQEAMDRWLPALVPCAKWAGETGAIDEADASDVVRGGVRVGLRVAGSGAIVDVAAGDQPLDRCIAGVLRRQRLPAGAERLYAVSFEVGDPDLPEIAVNVEGVLAAPPGFAGRLQTLASGARDCLPRDAEAEGELPLALTWRVRAGARAVELGGWVPDPNGHARAALACVRSRLAARVALAEPAPADALGLARFTIAMPARDRAERPQPTTMLAYELRVTADLPGAPTTTLRLRPGAIPPLRLRVSPVLAKPGETVTAQLIRGPSFSGKLPKELQLSCAKQHGKAKVDADHRARLPLEAATEGWCEVSGGGVRALVYVQPRAQLAVKLQTAPRYRPGDQAELHLQTLLGGVGGPAAVGLIGVDASLGQLVALPGPDELGRVRPKVGTSAPAFGVLDGQALALGRIRGANAAAATVLRVTSIPAPPDLDATVSASAESHFDPVAPLTDHFYTVLAELHVQARQWEAHAPRGEKMRPATMAALWHAALVACHKRGAPVDDAYGRPLRLSHLPPDLLALTDPRAVIVHGTRLPEDVENWAAWVAKEKP